MHKNVFDKQQEEVKKGNNRQFPYVKPLGLFRQGKAHVCEINSLCRIVWRLIMKN